MSDSLSLSLSVSLSLSLSLLLSSSHIRRKGEGLAARSPLWDFKLNSIRVENSWDFIEPLMDDDIGGGGGGGELAREFGTSGQTQVRGELGTGQPCYNISFDEGLTTRYRLESM